MNKKAQKKRRGRISREILMQYFGTLIGFVILFFLFIVTCWTLCHAVYWQADNPIYWILSYIRDYIIVFAGIPLLIGFLLITYYYMTKQLRYMDSIVEAAGRMITDKEAPIHLPIAIQDIEDELNLFREQGIRNEMLAKEAEQRKNDLIVYLAHDLKTPLTSVIGYLTLLQDEPQISPELRARYTGIALEKAERLEVLINDFFDITRFNLTTLTLEPELTNLTRMLEQTAYEFKPLLLDKDLTIVTELAPGIEISCDRDKLERVFDNLIRNAINYSFPETEIMLTLQKQDRNVQIIVQNQGKTIPPEKLNRIFEQFFRLDSSRSTATGGSGLGLAISKEIVELHGGTITAASRQDTITFTILLPINLTAL